MNVQALDFPKVFQGRLHNGSSLFSERSVSRFKSRLKNLLPNLHFCLRRKVEWQLRNLASVPLEFIAQLKKWNISMKTNYFTDCSFTSQRKNFHLIGVQDCKAARLAVSCEKRATFSAWNKFLFGMVCSAETQILWKNTWIPGFNPFKYLLVDQTAR